MNTNEEIIKFCEDEIEWIEEEIYNYPRSREYAVMQFNKIITLFKTQQEMVTKFSSEVDEQQKNLDQIDLWAMEIQGLIKKIRGKI